MVEAERARQSYHGIPFPVCNDLWVRLEDAQKEIDELKQKLQQFKRLLSEENEPKLHVGSANFTNIARFRIHMRKIREKFNKLFEENKK